MTELTITIDERELDALNKLAVVIGASSEALARGAIRKLIDDLAGPGYEPFRTEDEAADFVTDRFKEALDEVW